MMIRWEFGALPAAGPLPFRVPTTLMTREQTDA